MAILGAKVESEPQENGFPNLQRKRKTAIQGLSIAPDSKF